ncbi:MAG: UDP-N-acetylmuramoyl-L-alanyl-D-glutamate--2,6-diaminopimelate ligase [Saprospiraceae bacterium]|nr:UDP-N-acetylmuramoyl-L-alanyl-D-glutamate--2,6-diaminopimelate ligase [Saprospiraceae bacterium]
MKHLEHLIQSVKVKRVEGTTQLHIDRIEFDSRKVQKGDLFVAVRGAHVDGHLFIKNAEEQGARVIICEKIPENVLTSVTYIEVENSAIALGVVAHYFYDQPSTKLKLVAITGTNGKTTTTTLLYDLFTQLGYKCGLLSTVENRIAGEIIPSTHTTPDAISISKLLAMMVDKGCTFAFMEASSHAIHQYRVAGLDFTGALFSNITHDHMDYHVNFNNYIDAKKMLFDQLSPNAFALTNIDDKKGLVMLQNTLASRKTYSLHSMADFKGKILENNLTGLHMLINQHEVFCKLIGDFNAYNIMAAYGCAMLLQQDEMEVLTKLSQLKSAEGRFDHFHNANQDITAIIDYAHTPDALEKVLETIRELRAEHQNIITVIGCGGDRDKLKRPKMANIACEYSHTVILTSDNPRSEDPDMILKDMELGVPITMKNKVLTISDRKQAIRTAVKLARKSDIILVAGKGHEKYQEINGEKHPFDDKIELITALDMQ